MDLNTVSRAYYGRLILSKKARIFAVWIQEARRIFGPEIKQLLLENRMFALLDVVAEALGTSDADPQSVQDEVERATEHGFLRAEQGFNAGQVVREFRAFRHAIRDVCIEVGMPLTEEARLIIEEVIDSAAAVGLSRFSKKQTDIIKEEDARQVAFLVHDFRTPLGAIALAVADVIETLPAEAKTPETLEALDTIERNTAHLAISMEKAMRELSDVISGGKKLQITEVPLFDSVAKVMEQLKMPARAKRVILSNRVDASAILAASQDALDRVLMNLIGNALRYTTGGEITVASSEKGDEIEVVVQDTGSGIIPEKLARIFDPGEKEPESPGMGFGLAIAKSLVELQGGRIRIESTVNKGTAVIFTLPRVP
ncbi:MAG: sensor histidine kinase [Chthoniobacteraceae bacterium]